jgi:hypothetical protein
MYPRTVSRCQPPRNGRSPVIFGGMDEDVAAGWDWTKQFASLGFALTFAQGRRGADLLTAFGVEPGDAQMLTLEEADESFGDDRPVIRAGETAGWAFAFEEFGSMAGDEDIIRALSAGTQVVSVLRTADGTSVFRFAEDGHLVCAFDPAMPQHRGGTDPDRFVRSMRALGLDPDGAAGPAPDPVVAALGIATVDLDIRLDESEVEGPLLSGESAADF